MHFTKLVLLQESLRNYSVELSNVLGLTTSGGNSITIPTIYDKLQPEQQQLRVMLLTTISITVNNFDDLATVSAIQWLAQCLNQADYHAPRAYPTVNVQFL